MTRPSPLSASASSPASATPVASSSPRPDCAGATVATDEPTPALASLRVGERTADDTRCTHMWAVSIFGGRNSNQEQQSEPAAPSHERTWYIYKRPPLCEKTFPFQRYENTAPTAAVCYVYLRVQLDGKQRQSNRPLLCTLYEPAPATTKTPLSV